MSEAWITAAKLLAVVALVLANGFFVASEFALVAIRRSRVDEMVAAGVLGARGVLRATRDLDQNENASTISATRLAPSRSWASHARDGRPSSRARPTQACRNRSNPSGVGVHTRCRVG